MNIPVKYQLKENLFKTFYSIAPFSLKADMGHIKEDCNKDFISCLICTARPSLVLETLLKDLINQNLAKDRFEIILWDNSPQGVDNLAAQYSSLIPIQYFRDKSTNGLIGQMRNQQLKYAQGEYVLFLDDDTRLPQEDFLTQVLNLFKKFEPDILLPLGKPIKNDNLQNYHFLDPFSFATRCCFYKRSLLKKLHGFRGDIAAYEDIDLAIRATLAGAKIIKAYELNYQHPPLYFYSLQKPLAIGESILKLRHYYPLHIWIMIYMNALRFLPLVFWPTRKNRQWFKISLGNLCALWTPKGFTYQP